MQILKRNDCKLIAGGLSVSKPCQNNYFVEVGYTESLELEISHYDGIYFNPKELTINYNGVYYNQGEDLLKLNSRNFNLYGFTVLQRVIENGMRYHIIQH